MTVYRSKVDSATAAKSVVFVLVRFVTVNRGGILETIIEEVFHCERSGLAVLPTVVVFIVQVRCWLPVAGWACLFLTENTRFTEILNDFIFTFVNASFLEGHCNNYGFTESFWLEEAFKMIQPGPLESLVLIPDGLFRVCYRNGDFQNWTVRVKTTAQRIAILVLNQPAPLLALSLSFF